MVLGVADRVVQISLREWRTVFSLEIMSRGDEFLDGILIGFWGCFWVGSLLQNIAWCIVKDTSDT